MKTFRQILAGRFSRSQTSHIIKEEDGKICCPGVGDDTANLVALLLTARYVTQKHLSVKYYLSKPIAMCLSYYLMPNYADNLNGYPLLGR